MIQGKYSLTNFLRSSFWLRCLMTRDVIAFWLDLFSLMAPSVKHDDKKCCECYPSPKGLRPISNLHKKCKKNGKLLFLIIPKKQTFKIVL